MPPIDQQFIEFIVKSLVGKPDAVSINRTIDEKGVLLELTVDPDDLGRVIGKRGATAQSLRTLLRALGTKNEARYNLKIVDNSPIGSRPASADSQSVDQPTPVQADDQAAPVDDAVAPAPVETSQPEAEQVTPANESPSMVDKTRKELEDLDDLDI